MKSLKQANIFFFVLSSCLIISCGTRVNPLAPQVTGCSLVYTPELSIINIPIEIPNKLLEDSLNAMMKGLIVDDQSYDTPEKDDIKIKVWINGRIKTTAMNNVFYSAIPIKVWAQGQYDACDICPIIEKETNFETILYFSTKIAVTKDYKLATTTTSNGFTWITEPKLYFGPIGISIKSKVEKELDKTLKASAKEIDKNVSGGFDLRTNVLGVWKQMQEPIQVDSATQTWLKMKPVEFFMSPIVGTPKSLKLNLGVKAYIETTTGTKKPDVVLNPVLPDLKTDALADNTFSINLTSRISYAEATNIANRSIAGQEYQMGKKTVLVDSIRVWGMDNKLAVKTSLNKAVKGTVYLSGKPVYNIDEAKLYMKDVDFDISTKNVLHKSAAWMIDGLFSKKLEQKLVFGVGEQLDSVKIQINDKIANYPIQNLFTLAGRIEKLEVRGIFIEPEGIKVALSARGSANITVGITAPKAPKKK